MRILLVAIFLILFFLIGLIMNGIVYLCAKKNPKKRYSMSYHIIQVAFRLVLFLCGTRKCITGKENLTKDTCLYVGNHRSYFDILVTQTSIASPVGYVAKDDMLKIPFLRTWMRNIGCLFLNRKDPKEAMKTIIEGINMLNKDECSIYIFPEGTRGHDESMAPFKKGSFKMAEKAKVPIVPVAVYKTDDIFENNGWFRKIRSKKVYISFGKPIDLATLEPEDKKHIDTYVQNIVAQMIEEQKQLCNS